MTTKLHNIAFSAGPEVPVRSRYLPGHIPVGYSEGVEQISIQVLKDVQYPDKHGGAVPLQASNHMEQQGESGLNTRGSNQEDPVPGTIQPTTPGLMGVVRREVTY